MNSLDSLLIDPSEGFLICVPLDADPKYEFSLRLANQRMGISVYGILALELALILSFSEGECLSIVHGDPAEWLLGSLEWMCVRLSC